jgi:hypothetical protein
MGGIVWQNKDRPSSGDDNRDGTPNASKGV